MAQLTTAFLPCCICRNGIKATGDSTVIIVHKKCGYISHPECLETWNMTPRSRGCPGCKMSQFHHCFPDRLKINTSRRKSEPLLAITSNNLHSENNNIAMKELDSSQISNTMKELNSQLENSLNSQSESNANLMKILLEMQNQLDSFCRNTR